MTTESRDTQDRGLPLRGKGAPLVGAVTALSRFAGFCFSMAILGVIAAVLLLDCLIWIFDRGLPNYEQLENYEPPIISRIFSGEGELIDEFAKERRLFSPIEEIPPLVKTAFISAEDKNFYFHKGYDPIGIVKAFLDAVRGGRLRGASTITQQVMKNFLLGNERSIERKLKELILAYKLERTLDKDEILELYLNQIFLGRNSYGVTAAAQTYFNKSLDELEVEEAAYLAALPKAPSRYHPLFARAEAVERRNFVITEMIENGYLSSEAGRAAKDAELRTVLSGDFDSFRSGLPGRDYFTDEIRRQLSDSFGEDEFFSGGLTIRATVDAELQAAAVSALRDGLVSYDMERSSVWHGTGLSLDPELLESEQQWRGSLANANIPRDIAGWMPAVVLKKTTAGVLLGIEGREVDGEDIIDDSDVAWVSHRANSDGGIERVRGIADIVNVGDIVLVSESRAEGSAGQNWSLRQIPRIQGAFVAMDANTGRVLAMQGGFSYEESVFNRATQARRQPGSSFKPFVYAAALDSGYTPATIVIDAPIEFETPEGLWQPKNSGKDFLGPVPIRKGIEQSRNLMTIRLAHDVGMETVASYAENFGIYEAMDPFLANSLGSQETTLLKMVSGYAMFANGGERVLPTLVDRVQDRWGKTVYMHDTRFCLDCGEPLLIQGSVPQILAYRTRVIDAITAYQITSMMKGVVERGTASRSVRLEAPVAGKTGTTNESRDAWFIGFSPDIVAGCYMGFDEPRTLGRHAYGSNLCGPVFSSFMEAAIGKYGSAEFKVPDGGIFVEINRFTGEPMHSGADRETSDSVIAEYFRFGSEPEPGELKVVDGGFVMGSDLKVYNPEEEEEQVEAVLATDGTSATGIDDGGTTPSETDEPSSFGALSSGGLY